MEKTEQTARDYYTIDIFHMLKYIWKKVWIVVIVGLLTAAVGFSASAFFMTPKYSASVMLYINNKTLSIDGIGSITPGDITGTQQCNIDGDMFGVCYNNPGEGQYIFRS